MIWIYRKKTYEFIQNKKSESICLVIRLYVNFIEGKKNELRFLKWWVASISNKLQKYSQEPWKHLRWQLCNNLSWLHRFRLNLRYTLLFFKIIQKILKPSPRGVTWKNMFCQTFQISHKNTCEGVSYIIEFHV